MAQLFSKVLNFVGWESEEETIETPMEEKAEVQQPSFLSPSTKKSSGSKVVNLHTSSQMKVVIMQPASYDEAQDICNHLKGNKPVVINLEDLEKDIAQRIIDFLSGSVYALEGSIQKVSNGIFLLAPNSVDVMGDFSEEMDHKGSFPWIK